MGEKILADAADVLKEEKSERMEEREQDPASLSHLETLLGLLSTHAFCLSIFGGGGLHLEGRR